MKSWIFSLCLIACSAQAAFPLLEAKASYFVPTGSLFSKIYGGGGLYEGELTWKVYGFLNVWTSVGYFHQSGHALGQKASTNVSLIPLCLGLKGVYPFKKVELYGGIGGLALYAQTKDKDSPFVKPQVSKWGPGAIVKAGAWIKVRKALFLDLFSQYSTATAGGADLSGWSCGAGAIYRWGYNE